MKLTEYIVNPVMETDHWISNESLQLHIKFVSSELSKAYYYRMAEWINENFVVDFLGKYNIEAQSRDKYVASAKKFLEIFEQEMKKYGNTTFSYGATKKTKKFPSKKSVEKEMEKINYIHFDENKEHQDAMFYDAALDFSLFHQFEDLMKGKIVFEILTHSLGDNLEVMARLLKQYLLEFCEEFPEANGYVTVGSWLEGSEEQKYFNNVPDGKVIDENGKEYWIEAWLDIHYIDELAWVNIFPERIGEKLKEIEIIGKSAVCKFSVKDGLYILESQKSIKEHHSRIYKDIYSCFENCLRPGFSVWRMTDLRTSWEDLYFPESHYRIEKDKVYFSRGTFDFITKTEDVSEERYEEEMGEEEVFLAVGEDWWVYADFSE